MDYKNFVAKIRADISGMAENQKKNYLREELQKIILAGIYKNDHDVFFLWGTNLRISYGLDRFSEDLDFALAVKNLEYPINTLLQDIHDYLTKENAFDFEIRVGNVRTVRKADLKFPNILYDTWIGSLKSEKLVIKLEIDTNPPEGAEYTTRLIQSANGPVKLRIQNIETTFAGKIGAFLLREYVKGRDYYDMYWYLENQKDKRFNLPYIQNVIKQYNDNNGANVPVPKTHKETLNMVLEKAEETDYSNVVWDLRRFVNWSHDSLEDFFESYVETLFESAARYEKEINKTTQKFRL